MKKLQAIDQNSKLLMIWDGASYHKYSEVKTNLQESNYGLAETQWQVTCMLFAFHAPEQNPLEDLCLKGKNGLRKHFAKNKTFAQVKPSFPDFLTNEFF